MNNATLIPLTALEVSQFNVRKTGGQSVGGLAASIRHHGLLHNLVVRAGAPGRYEVVDGSRRLKALQILQANGELPADHEVPCNIVANNTDNAAAEASLAANTLREAMHPADACDAFRNLIENQGQSVTDVAAHFGVTELFVKQRLKLAKVSPKIIAAFREGKVTLELVEAFAISDDHEEQERVLASGHPDYMNAANIRRQLTAKDIASTDPRVKLIGGLEAYEAAGGMTRRDIFDEPGNGAVMDAKLLNRLVKQTLEKAAEPLRAAGWSFVDIGNSLGRQGYQGTNNPKADKAKTGAFVFMDWQGELRVEVGLKRAEKETDSASGKKAGAAKTSGAPSAELSHAAGEELALHRLLEIGAKVVDHPRLAKAMLATAILITGKGRAIRQGADEACGLDVFDSYCIESAATHPSAKKILGIRDELGKALPAKSKVLPWAMAQSDAVLDRIIAYGVSVTVAECYAPDAAVIDLASVLGVNIVGTWALTGQWLAKQSPAYIVAAVTEACGKAAGEEIARVKSKDEAAGKAAKLLVDRGWLPKPLRGPGYALKPAGAPGVIAKEPPAKRPGSNPSPPKGKKPAPPPNPPKAKTTKRATPKKAATKKPGKKAAK